jgi:uncharacterized protein (TIGR03435 family)
MTTAQFLAEWALRSSILIVTGALLLWALRVKDPSIRLAAWTAVLCGSLAIPAITAAAPTMPLAMIRVAARPVEFPVVVYEATPAPEPAASRPVHGFGGAPKPFDWARAAVTIYVLAAGALLLRLCFGLAMSRRLLHTSRATGHATEGIEIRESDRVASPVALGIVRTAILLPSDWREWDSSKLEAVLAHERSHIRRRDPAVQLLSAIHRALLWHSPLSWFLHRRIVRVAEEASDDAAVAAICDRASYAEVLLDFMQQAMRANWQGVPMARYGAPAERIHRILDGTALSRGVTRWSVAAILALGAPLAYLVAAVQAAPIQATAPQQAATGSSAGKPLTFDVASVKPAIVPDGVNVVGERMTTRKGSGVTIPRNSGGPGTDDPGRIHYPLISLKALLVRAWDSYFEIVGPGWLDTQIVQVDATMPPDSTKAQFQEMLRNLITDRFQLKHHTETKQITGYALMVTKNGPKMKESADQNGGAPARPPRATQRGPDGFMIIPPSTGPMLMFQSELGDKARLVAQQQTMQDLARELGMVLRTTATDGTGLNAKYDFTLTFAGGFGRGGPVYASPPRPEPPSGGTVPVAGQPDAAEPLPDIFSAVQSQLGLKLEQKKVPVEVFVVDHMEKTPTGN